MSGKRVQVRTHFSLGEPVYWLHALEPLEFGRASLIRSEWRPTVADATVFPSRGYAEGVAENCTIRYRYSVVPAE